MYFNKYNIKVFIKNIYRNTSLKAFRTFYKEKIYPEQVWYNFREKGKQDEWAGGRREGKEN